MIPVTILMIHTHAVAILVFRTICEVVYIQTHNVRTGCLFTDLNFPCELDLIAYVQIDAEVQEFPHTRIEPDSHESIINWCQLII